MTQGSGQGTSLSKSLAGNTELQYLSHEKDPQLYYEGLLNLGKNLERRDQLTEATVVYEAILRECGMPNSEGGISKLRTPHSELRTLAQERLDAIHGVGSSALRLEFNFRRIGHEAASPTGLFAMGAAGAAFKLTKLATLSRLATTPIGFLGRQAIAHSAAFFAETATFTLAGKSAAQLTGIKQDWRPRTLAHEWAGGAAMLLGLKAMGGLTNAAVRRLGVGAHGRAPLQQISQMALPQFGMLSGIMLGNKLSELGHFREHHDNATSLTDSLLTLLQFNVSGHLLQGALGEKYQRFERELDLRTETVAARSPGTGGETRPLHFGQQFATEDGLSFIPNSQLLTPNSMQMSAHDGSGEGDGRAPEVPSEDMSSGPRHKQVPVEPGEQGSVVPLPATVRGVPLRPKDGNAKFETMGTDPQVLAPLPHPSSLPLPNTGGKNTGAPSPEPEVVTLAPQPPTVRLPSSSPRAQDPEEGATVGLESGVVAKEEPDSEVSVGAEPSEPPPSSDTIQSALSSRGVRQEGDEWFLDVTISPRHAETYAKATGNTALTERGILPSAMNFVTAFPTIVAASGDAMSRAPLPTVIHGTEEITYLQPFRPDQPARVRLSRKMKGREGQPQMVILSRDLQTPEGEVLATGRSVMSVGADLSQVKAMVLNEEELKALPTEPVLTVPVTAELIDRYMEASRDHNPVHADDAGARDLGLPGRILHGMATFNLAERALFAAQGSQGPMRPHKVKATFKGIARPPASDGSYDGDTLRFFVQKAKRGDMVTVLNQRNEVVMLLEQSLLPAKEFKAPAVDSSQIQPLKDTFGRFEIEVNVPAGYQLVKKAIDQMAPHLPGLRGILDQRPDQPWFIAGISDGMGFHYTTALLAAGVRNLVGGYYEPDGLLKANSEVHLARMARVEGLKIYAREIGANFSAFYKDLVIPQWRNKDENKNLLPRPIIHEKPFPGQVRLAIESARRLSWVPDIHLANSIAFAQHMSPSPGMERLLGIPTVDIQGRILMLDMKPYDEEKYQQGTIDPMGRNHEYLLRSLSHFFGPQSISYFFTWAGGSQNRHILRGVYGDGALGDAKEMGETAAIRYHLESQDNGFNRGYHKIVRFPDFPTFALFGIPGGGGMGLIARHVLESHDRFLDVPDLAPMSLIAALGGENNLRNVAAQIELDVPESYHIQEIADDIGEFHRRARQHRQEYPERWKLAGMQKIATLQSLEDAKETLFDAKEILLGSAAAYRREHPELEGRPIPPEVWQELRRGPNRPLVSENYVDQIPKAWD